MHIHIYYVRTYTLYVYTYLYTVYIPIYCIHIFHSLLATRICFGKSSEYINEYQRSVMFTLNLTNPLLTDIVIAVATTDGSATGKLDYYH